MHWGSKEIGEKFSSHSISLWRGSCSDLISDAEERCILTTTSASSFVFLLKLKIRFFFFFPAGRHFFFFFLSSVFSAGRTKYLVVSHCFRPFSVFWSTTHKFKEACEWNTTSHRQQYKVIPAGLKRQFIKNKILLHWPHRVARLAWYLLFRITSYDSSSYKSLSLLSYQNSSLDYFVSLPALLTQA